MTKAILVLFLTIANAINFKTCRKTSEKESYIFWSQSSLLKWNDFKGTRPFKYNWIAASSVQIKLDYIIADTLKGFDVICFFNKNESWSIDTSMYGLKHEQGHFDLGEIQARLLRKSIIENRSLINKLPRKRIDSIYYFHRNKLIEAQNSYDSITLHSMNRTEQENLNAWIIRKLDSLKEYKRQ